MMTGVSKTKHNTTKGKANQRSDDLLHEVRQQMICEAAYFRSEDRGFSAGGELGDWLAAEAEINQLDD